MNTGDTPPDDQSPVPMPTLQELRFEHHFDIVTLAYLAEVNDIVVYKALAGHAIKRWQAEDILEALSLMYATEANRHPFTLETVQVALLPEPGEDHHGG